MWWVVPGASWRRVIQDRWCADRRDTGKRLINRLRGCPGPRANADGDPAADGNWFPNSWSLQCGVPEGSGLTGTFKGVDLES